MTIELANNPGEGEPIAPDPQELATEAANETETEEVETEGGAESGNAPTEQPPPDETEEIEHDGKKYRIPRPLKDGFMFHADYTRKTQALADAQRAHQQKFHLETELLNDVGKIALADDALKNYEQQLAPWRSLPEQYLTDEQRQYIAKLNAEYAQLKFGRDKLANELDAKKAARSQELQREATRRLEEGEAILRRDIKDWNEQSLGKLQAFAKREFGFTPEEIAGSCTDPRIIKALHRLQTLEEKAAKAAAAVKTAQVAEAAKPPAQVGNRAPAAKISTTDPKSDRLSDEQWFKAERERMARQQKRA